MSFRQKSIIGQEESALIVGSVIRELVCEYSAPHPIMVTSDWAYCLMMIGFTCGGMETYMYMYIFLTISLDSAHQFLYSVQTSLHLYSEK